MNIKNTIIKHYKKFFDLHAKGIALDEDDHLNLDWAEDLVKNCFIPNVIHWVAIEEDMPEFNTWVIAHTKDGANHIAYFDKRRNEWVANSKFGGIITHWREEPKPPCV